jgi:hypothetical protein
MTLTWLDLCSGLGGASQPALDRGWRVVRVDIDRRFKPDIVADVRSLPLKPFQVDVLWASPPCQEFSKWGLRCFYPNPPEPDLSIAHGVREVIFRIRPVCWIVENVWASRPWLTKLFGQVRARPPGHVLWSNQLLMLPSLPAHKGNFQYSHASGKRWGPIAHTHKSGEWMNKRGRSGYAAHNGIEASVAALIPYEIGEAICIAVERRQEA